MKSMIGSAEEFVELRTSQLWVEYLRAAHESAPHEVWLDVIQRFPDMRHWGAQNKTVSAEVLAADQDDSVRARIAYNKKVPAEILKRPAQDQSPIVSAAARERQSQSCAKLP